MKYIINLIRIFVGVTFIVSGAVKLIDPLGFSFKLEEYFAPDVLNMPFLTPYAYKLSLFTTILEIVLGFALILGFAKKLTLLALLGLTIFFGFLTFYSAYFNKVTDCGCFGDAIKFTPWQSFIKDIILLFLCLILWWKRDFISEFNQKKSAILVALSVIFCIVFAQYTLKHLPIVDFRAYKIGTNIPESMVIPKGAPKPVFDYHWKFKVDGREETYTTRGAYPEVKGEFLSVETQEISKGYTPPIQNFTIEQEGEDLLQDFMQEEKLLCVISYDFEKADLEGFKQIKPLTDKALRLGYKVIGLTPSTEKAKEIAKTYALNFGFYFTDQTTLKTIIRSNPAVMVVEKGVITQKFNYRDVEKVELK